MDFVEKDSDQVSYEELAVAVNGLMPKLLRYGKRKFGFDSPRSEDFVQDLYIKLHRYLFSGKVIRRETMPSFIYTSFGNLCRDRWTDSGYKPTEEEFVGRKIALRSITPFDELLSKELEEIIAREVECLPDCQLKAFSSYIQNTGRKNDPKFRKNLFRARRTLRDKLNAS
ncbi:MAG: hypothetical protein AABX23_01225 [Nanoarchaeota archaeon]